MLAKFPNLKAIVAATAVFVAIFPPAPLRAEDAAAGAQRAPGVTAEVLLQDLALAAPAETAAIDRELQALWSRSGSAAMDLLLRRGRDAAERGDLLEAVEHLTALTDHAPEFSRGWYERARVYHLLGLYGPAVADLERALALNPMDYNAIFALGLVFEQFRMPDRAFAAYRRAKAIHPHHEEVSSALERLAPQVEGREL
ncbi:tetratricopeptide repeat protein [Nocardioides marinus]|nr:tetratricopeptide repeat protein [Nocardioides marinus]